MRITESRNGEAAALFLEGRLDTNTAPELETKLDRIIPDLKSLTLDLTKLDYVSSAGLRAMLRGHIALQQQGGELLIRNPNELVRAVLEVTGLIEVLKVE